MSRRSRLDKAKYKAGSGFIRGTLKPACGFESPIVSSIFRIWEVARRGAVAFIKPSHKPDSAL